MFNIRAVLKRDIGDGNVINTANKGQLTILVPWYSCQWHSIGDRQTVGSRFLVGIGFDQDFYRGSFDFACFYKPQFACSPWRFA